jgi:phage virion morphogenesis protein
MTIKVDGTKIRAAIIRNDNTISRLRNPIGLWPKVGSFIAMVERKQFATQGAYLGKPWKPLKPEYLQWKIKHGYSKRILVRTGAMRASLTSRPMEEERYKKYSATFGTNVDYAKYHQYGTRYMARRPMFTKNPLIKRGVKGIVKDYFLHGASRTTVSQHI